MAMNIDLKNLNMSDIKDQITKLLADKKTLTKIGIHCWCHSFIFNNLLRNFKSNG